MRKRSPEGKGKTKIAGKWAGEGARDKISTVVVNIISHTANEFLFLTLLSVYPCIQTDNVHKGPTIFDASFALPKFVKNLGGGSLLSM